jgi:hypothetical protein
MIYRKSSPNPPTLLLRIVATAGASALLGTAACSGTDPVMGSVVSVADSGDEFSETVSGIAPAPPQTHEDAGTPVASGPCDGGPCGTVAMPPDAGTGPCNGAGCGNPVIPDAGIRPCNGGPCGTVVMPPEDAGMPDGHVGVGSQPRPPVDSGTPDGSHCCIGVVGILPIPHDAGPREPCNGLPCGVIIHPDGGFAP